MRIGIRKRSLFLFTPGGTEESVLLGGDPIAGRAPPEWTLERLMKAFQGSLKLDTDSLTKPE